MKTNIGIVGYGNLGKAVERQVIAYKNFNLVAIFSRRTIKSAYGTLVEPYENYKNYQSKIDIMLLCGGSANDLEIQTPEILEYFDCVNTFDTHKKISSEFHKLNEIAKKSNHILIMSCGWDPGIFSIIRATMFAISKTEPITFWGKGISMGHSDAIRQIDCVVDGVQFTIPNQEAKQKAKRGVAFDNLPLHKRDCFVVANKKDEPKIEYKIKNIPNYFKGQPTKVNFVSHETLLKLKNKLSHKGEIVCSFKHISGTKSTMNFSVSMKSNPDFTASIILAYTTAVINMKENQMTGSFTPIDIPASFLFTENQREQLLTNFC